MGSIEQNKVFEYVENNISTFHHKRLLKLDSLRLNDVLKKKNPYLFKAKSVQKAQDLVEAIVGAYLSSSEEGILGDWLEGLAIYISEQVYNGRKSAVPGIDLEFDKDSVRYIVSIKSGPNWGNSSQIRKLVDYFNSARRVLRTSGSNIQVKAINGCCYGRTTAKNRYQKNGDYYKLCGQAFWELISDDPNLYKLIIEPLGYKAKEKNQQFDEAYAQKINLFTLDFARNFCKSDGEIDWEKIIEFNSKCA